MHLMTVAPISRKRQRVVALLFAMLMALVVTAGWMGVYSPPAHARVIQEHLPNDVILDKSIRTIKDPRGYSWQAIAFKNTQYGSSDGPYLRLVGFPGSVVIDRSKPMIVTLPTEQPIMQDDVSSLIFKNGEQPQQNVAQYRLSRVGDRLKEPTTLHLNIPIIASANAASDMHSTSPPPVVNQLELIIPQSVVREWLEVVRR